jgi:hypothetical protein
MSNISNQDAMRAAGKGSQQSYASAIAILTGQTDEAYIATLRQDYLIGALTGVDGVTVEQAIDYLPVADAKPGTKGKWSDFPVNDPSTFDATVHRPRDVHNAYRSGLMGWSRVRASAGLPSLKATTKHEPRAPKSAAETGVAVAVDTFVAPSHLDTAAAVQLAHHLEDVLRRVLGSKEIKGDAGKALRDMHRDMTEYLAEADKALAPATETQDEIIKRLTAELAKRPVKKAA